MMRNPRKLAVLAAGIALASMSLVATSPATATGRPHAKSQTHIVHPGESIQDAVDAAHRGDTVVVTAGTYYQTVVVQKNGLESERRVSVDLRNARTEVVAAPRIPVVVGSYQSLTPGSDASSNPARWARMVNS